jgi:hypothetical protein
MQRVLGEELVDAAVHHLGDDLRRLAGLGRARLEDLALGGDRVRGELLARHVLGLGERDVHRDVLGDLLVAFEIDDHGDLRARVHVLHQLRVRGRALEAAAR